MALTNLGFETGDVYAGQAAGWSFFVVTSGGFLFAEFGTGNPRLDSEGFESLWSSNESYLYALNPLTQVPAGFDASSTTQGYEDFESSWSANEQYFFAAPGLSVAGLNGGDGVDTFEKSWSTNESYLYTLPASTAASFDTAGTPEAFEDFEELWRSNESYYTTLPASTAASFDRTAPEAYEDFEESMADVVVTADASTNTFTTQSAHGLSNGNRVQFRNDGGALPAGLDDSILYYVIGATTLTYQVSMSSGGSAVDIGDPWSGTQYMQYSPYAYWRY